MSYPDGPIYMTRQVLEDNYIKLNRDYEDLLYDSDIIRKLLWLRHGCELPSLYGDDGEMQCGSCMIDFKRDTAEVIDKVFVKRGMDKLKKEYPDGVTIEDIESGKRDKKG